MDIGSLFLILALFLLVAIFVARPFFDNRSSAVTVQEHDRSALLAERDRIINAIQELEFDYAMGKIPAEDYPAQRAVLLEQGADTLRSLDQIASQTEQVSAEDRLESAIAARQAEASRQSRQPVAAGVTGSHRASGQEDDLEAMIAARRRDRSEKATGFCPQCGNPIHQSDKFCSHCGANI